MVMDDSKYHESLPEYQEITKILKQNYERLLANLEQDNDRKVAHLEVEQDTADHYEEVRLLVSHSRSF
jgi:hypothetical protein